MKKMRRINKIVTILLLIGLTIALLPSVANAASPPAVPATASSMEWEESFAAPGFSTQYGYDVAHVDDCDAYISTPGQPALPLRTVSILLPPGVSSVDVSLEELVTTRVEGNYCIAPAQEPVTGDQTASPTEPDTAVYSLSTNWPEEVYEVVGVTRMRQYNILVLRLYPLSYVPVEHEVYLNSYIRLYISWAPGQSGTHGLPAVLYSSTFNAMVEGIVSNPQAVKNYVFSSDSLIPASQPSEVGTMVTGDPAKYVIITPSSFASAAQPLADWKTLKGVDARVFSLGDIVSGYTGDDDAEKMKNFISDCYSTWGTEYVLLAGDTDYVPTRSLYCPDAYGSDGDYVPSDYYFADLSGNWDLDNDQIYGELSDNVDWGAEVFVGRLPARSSGELTTMVDKIIDYEQNPPSGDWRSRMLLCGAYSNYQNEDGSGWKKTDEAKLKEQIRTDLLPGSVSYTRIYEEAGLDPTDYAHEYALTFANVQTQLAEGYAYVNFAAHGSSSGLARKVWNSDDGDGVPESGEMWWPYFVSTGTSLSNGGMLPLIYGDACNSAEIDRTTCFGEYLVKSSTGGAIGYIGATRVSWYVIGWELGWGYNQELDYRFWQEFFGTPGNCPGEALYTSKFWYANNYNTSSYYHRKDLFTYVLIGDPEARIGTNDAPVASDDSDTTNEDTAVTINVLANDTDPDGDPLTVSGVTQGSNGTVTNNGSDVTYTPDADWNGVDTFTYICSDGNGGTDNATVTVTVDPVNDAPVAYDDSDTTYEDTAVVIDVLANDTDADGDPLSVSSVTDGSHGTVTNNATDVTYTPDAGWNGVDTFTYICSDGNGGMDNATVTVTVDPANDVPVANDDSDTTNEDTAVTIDVLANDTDADGDSLSVSGVTNGSYGTVTNNGSDVTYTPDADWNGVDTFTYICNDGMADSNTATVTVTVGSVNDAPVANDDSGSTAQDIAVTIDVLANDTDADGDSLSVSSVTDGSHGMVTNNGSDVTYTPDAGWNGSDSFTYDISDGNGGTDSATVYINVTAGNNAPDAINDGDPIAIDAPEDTVDFPINVLANDTDPDGDDLEITAVSDPANGSAAIDDNGTPGITTDDWVDYTPDADYNGPDSFTYDISDGNGGTDTATVYINVSAVNDAPVANGQSVGTDEDTSLAITLTASDVDGDALTYSIISGPTHGTLSGTAPNLTYTPNPGYNGIDSFTFRANDGTVYSNTATVTVTVNPVNDAPVANDDSATTDEDIAVIVDVTANDTDVDGTIDSTTVAITQSAAHGSLSVNGTTGAVTYTPELNYNGSDSFKYTVDDDDGAISNEAMVNITVNDVNDAPVANDDSATTDEDTAVVVDVTANDTDVDGTIDSATVAITQSAAHGSLSVNGTTGAVTYTPDLNYNGSDSFKYTVDDDDGAISNEATVTVNVLEPVSFIDHVATGEIPVDGALSGSYINTHSDDGVAERITEISTLGKPSSRTSRLEHKWTFDVEAGTTVILYANVWAPASSDGDTFAFSYSIDNLNFDPLFTIYAGTDDSNYPSADLNLPVDFTGTVYVRVQDTDRGPGNISLDTLYVDNIFIRTNNSPPEPPAAPSGLSATAASSSQINLNWTDHADNELGFHIERSPDGSVWTPIGEAGPNATSYSDTGLTPGTTYYYQVQAYNSGGASTYSNSASATTEASIEFHVSDIDGSSSPGSKGRWNATVTITVIDAYGDPVSGATVAGVWSNGASGSDMAVTDAWGQCVITKSNIKSNVYSVMFTITSVQHSSDIYDSSSNNDPDGDSDGTIITVLKPS